MDGDGGDEAFTSLSNSESINSEDFDLFEGRTSKFSTLSDLIFEESILWKNNKC
jgi:hypothetical protein